MVKLQKNIFRVYFERLYVTFHLLRDGLFWNRNNIADKECFASVIPHLFTRWNPSQLKTALCLWNGIWLLRRAALKQKHFSALHNCEHFSMRKNSGKPDVQRKVAIAYFHYYFFDSHNSTFYLFFYLNRYVCVCTLHFRVKFNFNQTRKTHIPI